MMEIHFALPRTFRRLPEIEFTVANAVEPAQYSGCHGIRARMLGKFIEFRVIQQWLAENEALISMMRFTFISRRAPGFGPFMLGAIKERIEISDFALI